MRRLRLSISALMVVVLVLAVAIAALREATTAWVSVLFSLTLTLLGVAVLGTIYRRGADRAFWLGLSLFGAGYFALAFLPALAQDFRPLLATTRLLEWGHERFLAKRSLPRLVVFSPEGSRNSVPPAQPGQRMILDLAVGGDRDDFIHITSTDQNQPGVETGLDATSSPAATLSSWLVSSLMLRRDPELFQQVGHCLFTLVFALIGGLAARRFQRTGIPRSEARS